MKKVIAMLMLLSVMCCASYGAEAADSEIYVRKEVFNAYMDSINSKFDTIMREMKQMREETREEIRGIKDELKVHSEEIKSLRQDFNKIASALGVLSERVDGNYATLSQKIDSNYATLSQKIDSNYATLSQKIDGNHLSLSKRMEGLEARIGDAQHYIYVVIVLLGIIMAFPTVQKFMEWRDSRKPSITLEDVKRLIEESKSGVQSA